MTSEVNSDKIQRKAQHLHQRIILAEWWKHYLLGLGGTQTFVPPTPTFSGRKQAQSILIFKPGPFHIHEDSSKGRRKSLEGKLRDGKKSRSRSGSSSRNGQLEPAWVLNSRGPMTAVFLASLPFKRVCQLWLSVSISPLFSLWEAADLSL